MACLSLAGCSDSSRVFYSRPATISRFAWRKTFRSLAQGYTVHVIALSIVTHISTDHMHNTARSEASFAEGCTYRRPGFNCVVKQLRFWLFKVDCEFKDCDLHVLRICHTCVIYTLRSRAQRKIAIRNL